MYCKNSCTCIEKFDFPQVALIVFLAHIGCFVPADAATVGLTDRFDLHITNIFLTFHVMLVRH